MSDEEEQVMEDGLGGTSRTSSASSQKGNKTAHKWVHTKMRCRGEQNVPMRQREPRKGEQRES